jgi:quinolinate synthase
VLIHPESRPEARALAHAVLSTGGMCDYVKQSPAKEFIIATEGGILHTLRKQNPEKTYIAFEDEVVCPNMKKGSLASTLAALEGTGGQIVTVAEKTAAAARTALQRMLDMSK